MEFLQDHVEGYTRKGALDGPVSEPSSLPLPRPPSSEIRRGHRDRSEISSENAFSEDSKCSSSSNLTSSEPEEHQHVGEHLFPEVVGNIDSSLHGLLDSNRDGTKTDAFDIQLVGLSPRASARQTRELGEEFSQHFDSNPHNTI